MAGGSRAAYVKVCKSSVDPRITAALQLSTHTLLKLEGIGTYTCANQTTYA